MTRIKRLKSLILISTLIIGLIGYGQNHDDYFKVPLKADKNDPNWVKLMYNENPNVHQVIDAYQVYYRTHKFVKNIHTQNYKYWLRMIEGLVQADGSIQNPYSPEYLNRIDAIQTQMTEMPSENTIWQTAGPFDTYKNNGTLSKRPTQTNIYAIAIAPSNTDILYAFSEGGGVFKTVDHGMSWTLISLNESFTSGQDIKVHPQNPDIVYLATGNNVYKTTDGGSNWTLNYTMPGKVEQFLIDAGSPNIVFAATASGLHQSTNDGGTWANIFNERCWDIEAHPLHPNTLYLSTSNSTLKRAELFKSVDGGLTWVLKDNGWYTPASLSNAVDRGCKIGVTPADPDRVYAGLIGDSKAGDNGWIGVYYSLDGANTWVNADGIDGGPYVSGNNMNTNWYVAGYSSGYHQGWYNFDLDVSHTDPDRIWIGTIWACESGNKGANIEYIRGTRNLEMHADIQDIDVVGNDIWYVSDGGINYSNTEMQSVEIRQSGIHASNFWGFSQGWNDDIWTGGRYHNGDAVYHENYGYGNSLFLGGAESATGYINPLDNRRCHYSDITDKYIPTTLSDVSSNISNLAMYPNQSYGLLNSSEVEYHPYYANHIFLGNANTFYKSTNGGSSFSPLYSFGANATVLEIEISRQNPDVIYCLVKDGPGRIYKSVNGGNTFTQASVIPSNSTGKLDITLNPANSDQLWVSSYYGNNGQKVYMTLNGGSTWINKTTSTLNNHRIRDIVYQHGTNDVVYVATDNGVFYWNNTSADWIQYNNGLPFVTRALKMIPFYRDSKIRMGSGRGVWEAALAVNSSPQAQPYTADKYVYCNRDTIQLEDYSVLNHSGASWQWTIVPAPAYISADTIRNPKIVLANNGWYSVTLTVTDSSGQSSTKTVNNMILMENACAPDSIPGFAMQTQVAGDYANVPDLEMPLTNHFTFSAWIKPDGLQDQYAGIVFNDGTSAGLNFKANNTLGYHCPGGSWSWNSNLQVDSSKWSHVAMVVTASGVTIYVNGESATHAANINLVQFGTMKIGSYKGWNSRNFRGQIDEVCIWNKALTEGEIRELRHLTRTGPVTYTTDLIAYYQFNLSNSSTVLDRIGTKHAYLAGGAAKLQSSAPVGGGVSHRLTPTGQGTYVFGNTGFTCDFNLTIPNGEIVASRLHLNPNVLPNTNQTTGNYWIVNDYSTNTPGIIYPFSFEPNVGTAFGNPASAGVFVRLENEHLNNWNALCNAANFNGGIYNYDQSCFLNDFSQFVIQSVDTNTIYKQFLTANYAETICSNDSLLAGGAYQNQTGTYYDTITVSPDIDSVYITNLNVLNSFLSNQDLYFCEGDSIFYNGQYYAETTVFYDSLQAVNGCDSIYSITLQAYLPQVSIQPFDPDTLCIHEMPISLTNGMPVGGVYSGTGVVGNSFNVPDPGQYSITYTHVDSSSCENNDSTVIVIESCLGLDETIFGEHLLIYPNPNQGEFMISKAKSSDQPIDIIIYDAISKIVMQTTLLPDQDSQLINIEGYSDGVYYIEIREAGNRFYHKVIKE